MIEEEKLFEPPKNKRECSDKQREHLARCREKARQTLEKRRELERLTREERSLEVKTIEDLQSTNDSVIDTESPEPNTTDVLKDPTPPALERQQAMQTSEEDREFEQFESFLKNMGRYKEGKQKLRSEREAQERILREEQEEQERQRKEEEAKEAQLRDEAEKAETARKEAEKKPELRRIVMSYNMPKSAFSRGR